MKAIAGSIILLAAPLYFFAAVMAGNTNNWLDSNFFWGVWGVCTLFATVHFVAGLCVIFSRDKPDT